MAALSVTHPLSHLGLEYPGLGLHKSRPVGISRPCNFKDRIRQSGLWATVTLATRLPATLALLQAVSRRRTRHLRCARQSLARDTSKPQRTTLYTKAGPDGELGDCPFSHSVHMALRLKGVDFDVVPCTQETKPAWLLEEVDGKMPCVLHEGVPHVESAEILEWIEEEFPEPSLAMPEEIPKFAREGFGLFPAIAAFTKNADPTKDEDLRIDLQFKLASLRAYLARYRGDLLCGDDPTILDCVVLPKLYVLEHSTAHFKGFSLANFPPTDEVREYYELGAKLSAFSDSAYSKDVGIWGWKQARGE